MLQDMPQGLRATPAPARYRTRMTQAGATVLVATGRLNYSAAAALRHQLHGLIEAGRTCVVVDLTSVQAIDSSGISALISGIKKARGANGDLRIAAPNAYVMKVLEQSKLNHILTAYPDAETAFAEPA